MKIKLPPRIKRYLLIKKIDKENLKWFLEKYNCQANKLPLEFIELLSDNPDFLVHLKNKTLPNSLLLKIVWNNYTLDDITFENSWLLTCLNFPKDNPQEVQALKIAVSKKASFQPQEYYFFKYEELEACEQDNSKSQSSNSIESYIDSINIPINNKLYEILQPHLAGYDEISLCCPLAPESLIQLSSDIGSIYSKEKPVFDENAILYIKFDDFKKLVKAEKVPKRLAQCQIIFLEDKEMSKELKDKLAKLPESGFYDNEYEKIKINHLLYIIKKSNIPNDLKLLYSYKIKKYYSTIADEDIEKKYENYSQLMQITRELKQIIGLDEIQELTNQFGEESLDLKAKPIDSPVYSLELFMIENYINDFEKMSTSQILQLFNKLSKEELITLLDDIRVLNKLPNLLSKDMSLEERLIAIERELFIINNQPNADVIKFIRRFKIDVEKLLTIAGSDIKSPQHINAITNKYGIYAGEEETNIGLENIIGYDTWMFGGKVQKLLLSVSYFFDSLGGEYKTRSIGLLEYDAEELIPRLEKSFRTHPIRVKEADTGICYVTDGLHRFSILKIHYLLEKIAAKKSGEELSQKYTIPVKFTRLDYFKTYCNYLLSILTKEEPISISTDFDSNLEHTGLSVVRTTEDETKNLDDSRLKELVNSVLQSADELTIAEIARSYTKYQSFRAFVDTNFEDLKERINNRRVSHYGKN